MPDGGIDAGFDAGFLPGLGFGASVLVYGDAIVRAVDVACTGAALAKFDAGEGTTNCYARFEACAVAAVQAYGIAVSSAGDAAVMLPAACLPEAGSSTDAAGTSP